MATRRIRKSRKSRKQIKSRSGGSGYLSQLFKSLPNHIPTDQNDYFIRLNLSDEDLKSENLSNGKNIPVWVVRGNRYIQGYLTYAADKYYLFGDSLLNDKHDYTGYLEIDPTDLIYKCTRCFGSSILTDDDYRIQDNFIKQIKRRKSSTVKDRYYNGQFPNPIYLDHNSKASPNQNMIPNETAVANSTDNVVVANSTDNVLIGKAMKNILYSKRNPQQKNEKRTEIADQYIRAVQLRYKLQKEHNKTRTHDSLTNLKKARNEVTRLGSIYAQIVNSN
jgi:hypothetical protein